MAHHVPRETSAGARKSRPNRQPQTERPRTATGGSRPRRPRIGPAVQLPLETLQPILDAPGLKFRKNGRQRLATAIGEAAAWFVVHRATEQGRIVPSLDAPRVRDVAAVLDRAARDLERALGLLTDEDGIAVGELMAWAGFEEDERNPPTRGRASGFERAERTVEEMQWLRDRLQAWSERTEAAPASRPGRPDFSSSRLEAIRILAPAYARAFGKPMGSGREGPTIRFLCAFFAALDDRPHPATLVRLIHAARAGE